MPPDTVPETECTIALEPGLPETRDAILGRLAEFNTSHGYPADLDTVAVVLRQDGAIVGGLWGKTIYDWMYVEYLVVPESLRGRDVGTRLMCMAEAVAIERGCIGAWLTTFSFQARGFYEKLGFEVFGELENSPGNNRRLFMRKRLQA